MHTMKAKFSENTFFLTSVSNHNNKTRNTYLANTQPPVGFP